MNVKPLFSKNQDGFATVQIVIVLLVVTGILTYISAKQISTIQDSVFRSVAHSEAANSSSSIQTRVAGQIMTAMMNDGGVMSSVPNEVGIVNNGIIFDGMTAKTRNIMRHKEGSSTITTTENSGPQWQLFDVPKGSYKIFGNKKTFVARKFTVKYNESNSIINPLSSVAIHNELPKIATLYEFPVSTFAAFGGNVKISNSVIAGSALATSTLSLGSAAGLSGSATLSGSLSANAGAKVGGATISSTTIASASSKLQQNLEVGNISNGSPIDSGMISVITGSGAATMTILSDMTTTDNEEGIPRMFRKISSPTPWQCYILPAYQCSTRIYVHLTDNTNATVSFYEAAKATSIGNGVASSTAATTETLKTTIVMNPMTTNTLGMTLLTPTPTNTLIKFDPCTFAADAEAIGFSPSSLNSIYIDMTDANDKRMAGDVGIVLTSSSSNLNLGPKGLGLVTPNTVYIAGSINTNNAVPLTVISNGLRFGTPGHRAYNIKIDGSRGTLGKDANDAVDTARDENGNIVSTDSVNLAINLSDATDINTVPPVVIKGWLILNTDDSLNTPNVNTTHSN